MNPSDRKKMFREMVGNDHLSQPRGFDSDSVDKTQDETLKMIFAPDPHTGIPRSDLAIVLSKDSRPEVAQYVRDTLMQNLGDTARSDSPDDAIEFVRSHGESLQAYGDRIKEIVSKLNPKDKVN